MACPTTYKIVLRGSVSARLLHPLVDDFTVDHRPTGETHLIGEVCDPSHLHGILIHLASVNTDIISVAPCPAGADQRSRYSGPIVQPSRSTAAVTTSR